MTPQSVLDGLADAETLLFYPSGPQSYIVSRSSDCRKIGTVTRVSQDWRSRRSPSWRFECPETGAHGTVRTRAEAARALLEVFRAGPALREE